MSDLLNEFKIFSKVSVDLKKNIKYFHVFNDGKSVLIVTLDDRVYGCGDNVCGMLGLGHYNYVNREREINELTNQRIIQFHIGNNFVIALSANKKLFVWGSNHSGQLGKGYSSPNPLKPTSIVMFENVKIKQIEIFFITIAILTDNRKVYVWGNNEYKLCDDNNHHVYTPVEKIFPNGVIIESIFIFASNSFAICNNGNVYIWGECENFPPEEKSGEHSKPRLINSIKNVKYIDKTGPKIIFLTNDNKIYITENFVRYDEINCSGHIIQKILIKRREFFTDVLFIDNNEAIYKISSNHNELCFVDKSIFDFSIKNQVTIETIEMKTMVNTKEVIGHGGFGKVFKCVRYGREYAIKKIDMIRLNRDIMDKNSEINIMWKLSSEYIANLYDYWIEKTKDNDEFLYMQMEFCDCNLKDFFTMLQKYQNLPDEIIFIMEIEILKQIFESVNYLHQNKVIHRDLKPSNILIKYNTSNGRFIKLCDFGLSVNHEWSSMTHTSNVGTNDYIAPEVKQGLKYSENADIYSIGIIIEKYFKLVSMIKSNARTHSNEMERFKNLLIDKEPKNRPNFDEIFNILNNFYFDKFIKYPKYYVNGFINCETNNYPDEIIQPLKLIFQYSKNWSL